MKDWDKLSQQGLIKLVKEQAKKEERQRLIEEVEKLARIKISETILPIHWTNARVDVEEIINILNKQE